MKKLLIITNFFWVSVIVLPSFVQPGNTNPANTSSYHLIDASLAKMMAENYRNFYVNTFMKKMPTAVDQANGTRNNDDARTIWFSTKKIREFMNDVEDKSLGSAGHDSLSGLRFYYIRYPENKIANNVNPWTKYAYFNKNGMPTNYQNKHSLMIVPTYFDSVTQTHVDFDPRKYDSNNKPVAISKVLQDLIAKENKSSNIEQQSFSNNPEGSDNPISAFKAFIIMPENSNTINAGSIVPPPYNTNTGNPFTRPANVPCTGADFMNFIDGYDNCGQQPLKKITDEKPKTNTNTTGIKVN
jgi:hypothetical protein